MNASQLETRSALSEPRLCFLGVGKSLREIEMFGKVSLKIEFKPIFTPHIIPRFEVSAAHICNIDILERA